MYTVKIHNAYSDGHESTHEALVPAPATGQDLDEWFEDEVWPKTGDGTGVDKNACYTATIIACDVEAHLGVEREWV